MKLGKYSKRSIRSGWHAIERQIVKEQSPTTSTSAIKKIAPKRHKALVAYAVAASVMGGAAQAHKDCSEVSTTFPYMLGGQVVGTGLVRYAKDEVCYGYKADPKFAESILPEKFCFNLKDVTPQELNVTVTMNGGAKVLGQPFPIESAALAGYTARTKCERPWTGRESTPAAFRR